jgi:translation initiation factor 2 alpha subunit (eIF-2alpha)
MLYYYKDEFPNVDDIVMCQIMKNDNTGVHVILIEYNDRPGFIPLEEVSSRRVRNIHKILKDGDLYPLHVISIDTQKGYIDLSNKYINNSSETLEFMEKYGAYKRCVGFVRALCHQIDKTDSLQEYLKNTLHLIPKREVNEYLRECKYNSSLLDTFQIDSNEKEIFQKILNEGIIEKKWNITYTFSVQSFAIDGYKKIVNILKEFPDKFNIRLLTSPNYTASLEEQEDKDSAIEELEELMGQIEKNMLANDCKFARIKEESI